jgi:hypothetical protein
MVFMMTIFALYSWETALNISLDASFDNMQEWEGNTGESREVNSAEAYINKW